MAESVAGLAAMNDRRRALSALNAVAIRSDRYSDFSSGDEKVGNDNLVLVGETGTPRLFLYVGAGLWMPDSSSDAQRVRLESADGLDALSASGFILRERGGRVVYFDRNGLIEKSVEFDGAATRYVRSPISHEITAIEYPHNFRLSVHTENGRIISLSGPEGLSVKYAWSGTLLASVMDSDGDVIRYEYDDGRLARIVKGDGSAVEIHFGYQSGAEKPIRLVSSTVNEENAAETFEYAPSERMTIHVDAAGHRTVYRFDAMHRTTLIESPDGTVTENEYDGSTGVLSAKKVNGDRTRYEYDGRGNLTRSRYSDGSTESWTWDSHDLETGHVDRDGYGTWTERDALGRVTSIVKGREGGASVRIYAAVWDAQGNLARERYGDRNECLLTWDANGYLSGRSIEYDGGRATESYSYDKAGRLLEKIDANGLSTLYEYPARSAGSNRIVVERLPSGLSRTLEWNSRKDLVRLTEADIVTGETRVTEAMYDRRHLLRKCTDGAGRISEFVWTPDGKISSVSRGLWKTSYAYDPASGTLVSKVMSKECSLESGGGSVSAEISENRLPDGIRTAVSLSSSSDPSTRISRSEETDCWGRLVSSVDPLLVESSIGVTPGGRVVREQLSWGGRRDYAFDSFTGDIASWGREGLAHASVSYNADGTLLSLTDESGNVTAYAYDGRGLVMKEQSARGEKVFRYDAGGRLIRVEINSCGVRMFSDISYDDAGRSVTVVDGGKYSTIWKLNAWGECVAKIDGEGGERKYIRDGEGSVVREIDANGKTTVYGINALGLVESVTSPTGIRSEYDYDCQGLPVRASVSGSPVWSGSYDCEGRLLEEKGWPGIDRNYRYDLCGRLTSVSSGGEIVEEYSYSDRGKKLSFMDGGYAMERDEFGRIVSEKNAGGSAMHFEYDDADRLIVRTAFSGKDTRFVYGASGSESVRYRDGSFSAITKTMIGQTVEASSSTGTIQYGYDEGGLLVRQEDLGSGDATTYVYDRAGRRVSMKNRDRNVSYAYDRNGFLSSVRDSSQKLSASLTRDDDGRVTTLAFGNGHRLETLYDSFGRIEAIREKDASRSIIWGEAYAYDAQGRKRCTVRDDGGVELYEYDRQSRLATVLYPYTAEQSAHDREAAVRFGLYFLPDAGHPEPYRFSLEEKELFTALAAMVGCAAKIGFSELVLGESFAYDRRGNRISAETVWGTVHSAYDRNNRLVSSGDVSYEYDLDGNLVSEKSLRESSTYEYTDDNRMKHSSAVNLQTGRTSSTSYAYDAFGRRTLVHDAGAAMMRTSYDAFSFDVLKDALVYSDGSFTSYGAAFPSSSGDKSSDNRYAWIGNGSVATSTIQSEANRSGAGSSSVDVSAATSRFAGIAYSLYAEGSLIASVRTSDSTFTSSRGSSISDGRIYFASDMLGSMRSVSDDSGRLLSRFDYDAFGSPVSGDYTVSLPSGYSGKSWDPNTRMYDYGYRDYAPILARFTTIDPIRDGYNWYAYAGNDPVDFKDLFGLCTSDLEQSRINSYISQNRENLRAAINISINDPRNQPEDGGDITHCNNVPPQVLKQLNIDSACISNKDKNNKPIPTRATDMLNNLSTSSDWHLVNAKQAQALANQGTPVIAGAPGHIGVVYPGIYSEKKGPKIGQAGTRNGVFSAGGSGFVSPPSYYAPNKW
jgi:RHS repeat-associated protein